MTGRVVLILVSRLEQSVILKISMGPACHSHSPFPFRSGFLPRVKTPPAFSSTHQHSIPKLHDSQPTNNKPTNHNYLTTKPSSRNETVHLFEVDGYVIPSVYRNSNDRTNPT